MYCNLGEVLRSLNASHDAAEVLEEALKVCRLSCPRGLQGK